MIDTRSIVENSNVGIVHLIISYKLKSWNKNRFFCTFSCNRGSFWKRSKSLWNCINNLFMRNFSCSYNYDIISIIVGCMIIFQMARRNLLGKISISFQWLAKHMLSIWVEMNIFKKSFFKSFMIWFMFSAYVFFNNFKVCWVKLIIRNDITKECHSFFGIIFEYLKAIASEFSIWVGWVLCSHVFNFTC